MKRLNKDENGLTVWGLLGIIIIILLIWQFAGNYLGIGLPTDFLSTEPSELEYRILMKDKVTKQTWEQEYVGQVSISFTVQTGHTYALQLVTNAPYKFSGLQYYLVWDVWFYNETSASLELLAGGQWNMPYTSLWDNTFEINIPVYYPDIDYRVNTDFYSPDGTGLLHSRFEYLHP